MNNNNELTLVSVGKNIFAFQTGIDSDEAANQEFKSHKFDFCINNKHLIRAIKLIEEEEDQKALRQLNLALKDNPDNCFALSYLSIVLIKYGNNRQALKAMEKAMAIMKNDYIACYSRMAMTCHKLGYAKRALNYAIKAQMQDQNDVIANQYITDYYYRHQSFDLAAEYADNVIANAPDDPCSYTLKGQIEMSRGNYQSALHLFEHAIEIDAHGRLAKVYYAKALLKIGKVKEAVRLMAKVWRASFEQNELDHDCAEARELFCREAFTAYHDEIERRTVRDKYSDHFMIELAQINAYAQHFETAALWLRKSFMLNQNFCLLEVEAYYWWRAGKRQKAFDNLVLLLMRDPDSRYYLEEVTSHEKIDNADFCFIVCDAIDHIYPDTGTTSFIRALYKEMLGKITEAIPDYDKLIRLCDGDNAWAEMRRAIAYDQMGCHAKAKKGYRAIIDTPTLITNLEELPLALLFLHGKEALYAPLSKYRKGSRTRKSILELLDEKIELTQMKFDQLTYVLNELKDLHLKRAAVRCRIGLEFEALDDVRWLIEHKTLDDEYLSHCFELQPLIGTDDYKALITEFQ